MQTEVFSSVALAGQLVRLLIEPTGQVTAQVPGIPELSATGATRQLAIEQLRRLVAEWLASGRLVSLQVAAPSAPPKPPGWAKDDALEQEFLEELARMRQADLERTLREYEQEDQACSNSSSTQTT
jgi:hypothetical protein